MDEQTKLFLWVLTCVSSFAALGGTFGAVTGVLTWKDGRAAGTRLGLAVARAFTKAAGKPLSPGWTGGMVGAIDGMAFGAGLGLVAALVLNEPGARQWRRLAPLLTAGAALVGGAVLFGLLAYGMVRVGPRVAVALFAGSVIGAFTGYLLSGPDGLFPGTLLGGLIGVLSLLAVVR